MQRYKDDSKYKKYVGSIERLLQSFEVEDWHDIIPFMAKLHKVNPDRHGRVLSRHFADDRQPSAVSKRTKEAYHL